MTSNITVPGTNHPKYKYIVIMARPNEKGELEQELRYAVKGVHAISLERILVPLALQDPLLLVRIMCNGNNIGDVHLPMLGVDHNSVAASVHFTEKDMVEARGVSGWTDGVPRLLMGGAEANDFRIVFKPALRNLSHLVVGLHRPVLDVHNQLAHYDTTVIEVEGAVLAPRWLEWGDMIESVGGFNDYEHDGVTYKLLDFVQHPGQEKQVTVRTYLPFLPDGSVPNFNELEAAFEITTPAGAVHYCLRFDRVQDKQDPGGTRWKQYWYDIIDPVNGMDMSSGAFSIRVEADINNNPDFSKPARTLFVLTHVPAMAHAVLQTASEGQFDLRQVWSIRSCAVHTSNKVVQTMVHYILPSSAGSQEARAWLANSPSVKLLETIEEALQGGEVPEVRFDDGTGTVIGSLRIRRAQTRAPQCAAVIRLELT